MEFLFPKICTSYSGLCLTRITSNLQQTHYPEITQGSRKSNRIVLLADVVSCQHISFNLAYKLSSVFSITDQSTFSMAACQRFKLLLVYQLLATLAPKLQNAGEWSHNLTDIQTHANQQEQATPSALKVGTFQNKLKLTLPFKRGEHCIIKTKHLKLQVGDSA